MINVAEIWIAKQRIIPSVQGLRPLKMQYLGSVVGLKKIGNAIDNLTSPVLIRFDKRRKIGILHVVTGDQNFHSSWNILILAYN